MKKFVVSLARIEHRVYQIEVEANSKDEAEELALETWYEDDEAFTDLGCVHAEEFINDVEEQREVA
jgi:hypothetical protein